jgi:phage pi2 protein 07
MSFFKKEDKKVEDTVLVKELKSRIVALQKTIDDSNRSNSLIIDDLKRNHRIEVEDLKRKHTDEFNKMKFDTEKLAHVEIIKARDEKKALEIENGVFKSEVTILRKAFENLGFDVKDMKEILNKLVDGIVSKNTINVVK